MSFSALNMGCMRQTAGWRRSSCPGAMTVGAAVAAPDQLRFSAPAWSLLLPPTSDPAVVCRIPLQGDEVQPLLHPGGGKQEAEWRPEPPRLSFSPCCPSGLVHDPLPLLLPLAFPRRLPASVRPQRPGHAALGAGVQVSGFLRGGASDRRPA